MEKHHNQVPDPTLLKVSVMIEDYPIEDYQNEEPAN